MKKLMNILFLSATLSIFPISVCANEAPAVLSIVYNESDIHVYDEEIQDTRIGIFLNGEKIQFNNPVKSYKNTIFVPMRELEDILSIYVAWDPYNRVCILQTDTIKLDIPAYRLQAVRTENDISNFLTIDETKNDIVAFVQDDITYLPLTFVSQNLDITTTIMNDYNQIHLTTGDNIPPTQPYSTQIELSIMGDVLLATDPNRYSETASFHQYQKTKPTEYFFQNVVNYINDDDFTIVNLENVLTDNNLSRNIKNASTAYYFKGPTNTTNILTSSSIEVATIENNHIQDYGTQGRLDTISALNNAGVLYSDKDQTLYVEKDGFVIAIISHTLWYEAQANEISKRVQEASLKSDYQVVYWHGGTEGTHKTADWIKRACRSIVDNGADLVIGAHPHVLQPMETYKGVDIVYSLGNFLFGGNYRPENATVLMKHNIEVDNFTGEVSAETSFIPFYVYTGSINNWQPAPMVEGSVASQKVLNFMHGISSSPL